MFLASSCGLVVQNAQTRGVNMQCYVVVGRGKHVPLKVKIIKNPHVAEFLSGFSIFHYINQKCGFILLNNFK